MLFNPPPQFRKRRGREKRAAQARAPLSLVSATYDADGAWAAVTFDRAIDLSGIVVAAFIVDDGPNGNHMVGQGVPFPYGPNGVQVFCHFDVPYSGPDVLLTVAPGNGIVAVDDGGTWAGVTELVLPFP